MKTTQSTQPVPDRLIVMGRVVGPWGVKGWLKVFPHTAETGTLRKYSRWWLGRNGEWQEFEMRDSAQHDRHLVVQVAGVDTPEQAVKFKGWDIALPRAVLPASDEGEFYLADLVGLEVKNRQGEQLGTVTELVDNGAHDVLRVTGAGRERLIPFVPAVVQQVDLAGGAIEVDWGLDW